jgi:CHAT domain-containing protein
MPQPSDFWKVLVAIQPETSGQPPLPGTRAELNKIQGHVPSKYLVRLGIPDAPASVESVYSHLSAASIVHLACHGQQDARNPLNSAFLLGDGPLKVSRIMRQSMPNASLAFLSACQTAMGDENLPDEAIHLAATLLFTGFRGAVATMW